MREITDTTNMGDLEDGQDVFTINKIEKRYGAKEFFFFGLIGKKSEGSQILFPNMMGPLLRALKCTETETNKFDWDPDEQVGKKFVATVSHATDKKDVTKIRQHMSDFKQVDENDIPF